jgi:transcriptional regulator with XRE-family HTH domain
MRSDIEIGRYLQKLRKEHKLSLREVAEHIGIDISMLSKIEHGERQLQSHMLNGLSDLFNLDYKDLQIKYLTEQIQAKFGEEPYFFYALNKMIETKKMKLNANNK